MTLYTNDDASEFLTTDEGLRVADTDNSLHAGPRGPSLLQDVHLREKITRFDHERIPERVVHARGAAAHGEFRVYQPLTDLTSAGFLQNPKKTTPVFVRFSTVAGPRGSADTVRDVRGFATKFYTEEGNFDLVGNNMPVFFVQDGIKFPDFVHAVRAEPHNEVPTAASAHDSFWDFVSLQPESAHMVMWVMSDRAIPRSYRMMEGFGVHTFRLINAAGRSRFVKFHWKPLLGTHSLTWDEAQKLGGFDCDFHRKDLWHSIEAGVFPEWELGLQVIEPDQVDALKFDLLDPTKLVPEELVPLRRVGRLTLNRNPENYFQETEQVAYCVSHLVPGIDVTPDPLLQARLFSYLDTQLTRLGGPNFSELPINRAKSTVSNYQQDGFGQHYNRPGPGNYHPNSIGKGCPFLAGATQGGFVDFPESMQGTLTRARSASFGDHFTQAAMFLQSLTPVERRHVTQACSFEISKVSRPHIRERAVELLANISKQLGEDVALKLGMAAPHGKPPMSVAPSKALSQLIDPVKSVISRQIACLTASGSDVAQIQKMREACQNAGAEFHIVALNLAPLSDGKTPDFIFESGRSVFFDAVVVPGGAQAVERLAKSPHFATFISESFLHGKAIGAQDEAETLVKNSLPNGYATEGVVLASDVGDDYTKSFLDAVSAHRHWSREDAS